MEVEQLSLKDSFILHPRVFKDSRGWFMESYSEKNFPLDIKFVQDNHSMSAVKGVFRGMHIQNYPYTQSKLIRCVRGEIVDFIVDIRPESSTYLKSLAISLTAENKNILFVPKGFLHGFLTMTDDVEVMYKVDEFYNKESERSVLYSDPALALKIPTSDFTLSEKDLAAPLLKDCDIKLN